MKAERDTVPAFYNELTVSRKFITMSDCNPNLRVFYCLYFQPCAEVYFSQHSFHFSSFGEFNPQRHT